jgi:hypothetical protein
VAPLTAAADRTAVAHRMEAANTTSR